MLKKKIFLCSLLLALGLTTACKSKEDTPKTEKQTEVEKGKPEEPNIRQKTKCGLRVGRMRKIDNELGGADGENELR